MVPVSALQSQRQSTASGTGKAMSFFGPGTRAMAAVSAGYAVQGPPGAGQARARVFVVDDEDFIRELYRDVFEARGYTVFSAGNGDEALRLFRTMNARPDAIIMDHRMPGKDGIETTRELLKLAPGIPIIFSSADESVREQALEAGAVSFWAKPFPVSLLVNAMVDMIEARKRHPQ